MSLQYRWHQLAELWAGLEAHLAGNFPRLWGLQVHWAVGLAITGLIFCLVTFAATGYGGGWGSIVVILVVLLQAALWFIWLFQIAQIPRPNNIVEYRNSPLLTHILILSVGVFAGPILLILMSYDSIPKGIMKLLPMFFGEFLFLGILFRFVAQSGRSHLKSLMVPYVAAAFFSAIVGVFLFWLDWRAWVVASVVIAAIGLGTCRVLLSIRAGWRSRIDTFWLATAVLVPPLCVAATLRGNAAFVATGAFDPTVVVLGIAKLMSETDATWQIYIGLFLVALWVDLAAWVQARLSMLPESEL